MAPTQYHLALSQYKASDFQASVNTAIKLLQPHTGYLHEHDTIDAETKMRAWNTLGLSYVKLNKTDSAFFAFDHALKQAKDINPFWYALVNGNKGDIYFQQGKYDSAAVKLQMDYEASVAAAEYDNALMVRIFSVLRSRRRIFSAR